MAAGERFDIGHQPVPVAMRYPSPLAELGIPYVMGPVGGSLESPPGFSVDEGTMPWYVSLRGVDRALLAVPWLRRTYSDAACVTGIAPYVAEHLRTVPLRRFTVLSETALEALPEVVERGGRAGPLRLLYVGRLVRTKGTREAIRALDRLRDLDLRLDVVGDGFDRAACEELSRTLGLMDRVVFHGRLPRSAIDDFYRRADVFVFPSYREPGGNVAYEAMGFGLPVVVCDRGGPGAAVDDTSGIRVSATSPEQLASDVADAIRRLAVDPALRASLGAGARVRVSEVGLWDRKLDLMDKIYDDVLGSDR
jgi:glycosyltransferase involved in cell wall biosynthesis